MEASEYLLGGAENHGELLPGLETQSGKVQHFLSWISELLWTSDSFVSPVSSFLNRDVYHFYPRSATPFCVGCVQNRLLSFRTGS